MSDEKLAKWFEAITDEVIHGKAWNKNAWIKWLQIESGE